LLYPRLSDFICVQIDSFLGSERGPPDEDFPRNSSNHSGMRGVLQVRGSDNVLTKPGSAKRKAVFFFRPNALIFSTNVICQSPGVVKKENASNKKDGLPAALWRNSLVRDTESINGRRL
jgi:hypothetical protein